MRLVSLTATYLMGRGWAANKLFGSGETYWTEAELRKHLKREGLKPKESVSEGMHVD